jgi:hypothetical protein
LPMHCLPSLLCRVFLRLRRVLPALGEEVDSGSVSSSAFKHPLIVKDFYQEYKNYLLIVENNYNLTPFHMCIKVDSKKYVRFCRMKTLLHTRRQIN